MRKAAVKEKRAVQSMQDLWGVQDIQDMKTCKTFYGADGETRTRTAFATTPSR